MIQQREQNLALVSLMYEGSCFTTGWRYVCVNDLEMFSVAKLQLLTSGLGFCVFSLGSIIYLVF